MNDSVFLVFTYIGVGFVIGAWLTFVFMAHRPWRTVRCQLPEGEYKITSAGPIEIESVDGE